MENKVEEKKEKKEKVKSCDMCKHIKALVKNTVPCSKCAIVGKTKFSLKKD